MRWWDKLTRWIFVKKIFPIGERVDTSSCKCTLTGEKSTFQSCPSRPFSGNAGSVKNILNHSKSPFNLSKTIIFGAINKKFLDNVESVSYNLWKKLHTINKLRTFVLPAQVAILITYLVQSSSKYFPLSCPEPSYLGNSWNGMKFSTS